MLLGMPTTTPSSTMKLQLLTRMTRAALSSSFIITNISPFIKAMGMRNKQNLRYKSLNPDLKKVMKGNETHQNSLTDIERKKNVSQRGELHESSSERPHLAHQTPYSHKGAMSTNRGEHSNERADNAHKKITPLFPRLDGKISGITTQNGTFKPYTYSVSSYHLI